MTKRTPSKTRTAVLGKSYSKMRGELMKRLEGVDANILISVVTQDGQGIAGRASPDFFSDWPDNYNRDHWYKTWGKAELADSLPAIDRPERLKP